MISALLFAEGCTSGVGALQDCPSNADALESMNAATYAVVARVRIGPGVDDIDYSTIGTAFAVADRLLATNAHITESFNGPTNLEIEEVVGVQSGTGTVVKLLRALTHPDYNGNPFNSPDVGLLTTQELLPSKLTLATTSELAGLRLGDPILLTGFPGDVDNIFDVIPGMTVPQATSLAGQITAFRNHDPLVMVVPENRDVLQHQAPTTPGTSGSAMVSCGRVVAANNAGTVQIVLQVGPDGQVSPNRTAAASNNFGVHAKYVGEMISLFNDQSIQGFALPPPFLGGGGGGGTGIQAFAGTYQGGVTTPATAAHNVAFKINEDGSITGTSTWAQTGNFTLTGSVNAQGQIMITDDAAQRLGFNTGIYVGTVNANGQATGTYHEGNTNVTLANWAAGR